ncbi:hypothetical protein [Kiloniella litopenaei]|uniref:hypothetical protein n=1 Tax=Kiloniella litopenaei TaxID=1549748 RepID=UPI003BA8E18B
MEDIQLLEALCPERGDKADLARELDLGSSQVVTNWFRRKSIPSKDKPKVAVIARKRGVSFDFDEFVGISAQ